MHVEFVPNTHNDLLVVNAARVSLGKHHNTFKEPEDSRLIEYLVRNAHWTPLAHPRICLDIWWMFPQEALLFYRHVNPAGFSWLAEQGSIRHGQVADRIQGSLYAWIGALDVLPDQALTDIRQAFLEHFPACSRALPGHIFPRQGAARTRADSIIPESQLIAQEQWTLARATLRMKVPIFVARQLRTSQVGFAYNEVYAEGESFVYNEVSRRYVSEEPEFYRICSWRVREGKGVKQGSTGLAGPDATTFMGYAQNCGIRIADMDYRAAITAHHIAPEQARVLLPQSLYTTYYQTGSLHRFAQCIQLRTQPGVQEETRAVVEQMKRVLCEQFPVWAETYFP